MSKRQRDDNKQIVSHYFQSIEGSEHSFKCIYCDTIRNQKPNTGYSNLMNHITGKHPDYAHLANGNKEKNSLDAYFDTTTKENNIFCWLDWIIVEGKPFNTVEKELTRKYSKLTPICTETLMKYMNLLTREVEAVIIKLLPSLFCLVFDGWTLDGQSTHFVALFATFQNQGVNYKVLLAFSTLQEENDFSAISHKNFIVEVLQIFGKNLSNIICLVGDNCNTNIAIAKQCNVPCRYVFVYSSL